LRKTGGTAIARYVIQETLSEIGQLAFADSADAQ
jgi:hypothetical protein